MEASELLSLLSEKGVTLGSCESMTGGLFGSTITAVPGASAVYKGGIISYCAEVKETLANVDPDTIAEEGVVSASVASEMAIGAKEKLGVDICVSVTGNAGPTTEEGGKPVGCVHLGLAYEDSVWTLPLQFTGERREIQESAVAAMIAFVASLFPPVKSEE